MSETKSGSSFRSIVFAAIVIFLAFIARRVIRRNWFLHTVHPKDFESNPNYTIGEIPTTYYDVGKLKEALPKWHDGKGKSYFHLYRIKEGQKFNVDVTGIDSETYARALMPIEKCSHPDSIVCTSCIEEQANKTHTNDILKKDSSVWYASFAKLEDSASIGFLFDQLDLPGFNMDKMVLEHAFISNFKEDTLTTPLHANSITSSMSVQFSGSKTWIFFPPHITLGPDYLDGFPGVGLVIPSKAPSKPYTVYVYKSQPGDVLFFSENWLHAVHTSKGKNVMMNFRLFEITNFLRDPINWLHAVANVAIFPNERPNKARAKERDFLNKIIKEIAHKVRPTCGENYNSKNSLWDQEMTKLIKSAK